LPLAPKKEPEVSRFFPEVSRFFPEVRPLPKNNLLLLLLIVFNFFLSLEN
jgi:hypothetical protein